MEDSINEKEEEFYIIPLHIDLNSPFQHFLYFKPHQGQNTENFESGKSLFFWNVPLNMTEEGLKNLFFGYGEIKSIIIRQLEAQRVAYLTFNNKKTVRKIIRERSQIKEIIENDEERKTKKSKTQNLFGLKRWLEDYEKERNQVGELEQEVNEFMKNYDFQVKKQIQELEKEKNKPDADGFIKVLPRKKKK